MALDAFLFLDPFADEFGDALVGAAFALAVGGALLVADVALAVAFETPGFLAPAPLEDGGVEEVDVVGGVPALVLDLVDGVLALSVVLAVVVAALARALQAAQLVVVEARAVQLEALRLGAVAEESVLREGVIGEQIVAHSLSNNKWLLCRVYNKSL